MMTGYMNRRSCLIRFSIMACIVGVTTSALAADRVSRSSVRMRLGETRSLGIFGGHSSDCTKSIPAEIRIVRPPALGMISLQENVPYVARVSLSGTCLGARFVGTAVLYTAMTPGSETVAFDAAFANGTDHHVVSVTVQ